MEEQRYPFFSNTECSRFPCHEGVPAEEFNCAFCYCPLYALGPNCGGDFHYTKSGAKSCIDCAKPHVGTTGIDLVSEHWPQLKDLAAQ